MTIEVKILADSVYWRNKRKRLTTFQLRYPRMIHSEVMTHRVFSRNASSSRAVPIKKVISGIQADPAMPRWTLNEPGMCGKYADEAVSTQADTVWLEALQNTIQSVEKLMELGIHKQDANRLLEPFSHISVVLSSTRWDHFMNVRPKPDAHPIMQELANTIRNELWYHTPEEIEKLPDMSRVSAMSIIDLCEKHWHLPYVYHKDLIELHERRHEFRELVREKLGDDHLRSGCFNVAPLISAARCARVSYLTHDGARSLDKDLELALRLLSHNHWSAFEHQACINLSGDTSVCRNFSSPWQPYRSLVEKNPPAWDDCYRED